VDRPRYRWFGVIEVPNGTPTADRRGHQATRRREIDNVPPDFPAGQRGGLRLGLPDCKLLRSCRSTPPRPWTNLDFGAKLGAVRVRDPGSCGRCRHLCVGHHSRAPGSTSPLWSAPDPSCGVHAGSTSEDSPKSSTPSLDLWRHLVLCSRPLRTGRSTPTTNVNMTRRPAGAAECGDWMNTLAQTRPIASSGR
jgi:hypothetical protein